MAGCVDQVDVIFHVLAFVILLHPVAEGGGRLDGDALLTLEIHGVHLCAHGIFASHLVYGIDAAGVEEDALGDGGLAGVNVRGDANVAHPR
jgi:hypothetical protein